MSIKQKRILMMTVKYFFVIVLCVIFVMPFVMMVSTSLKTLNDAFLPGGFRIIPPNLTWDNYPNALARMKYTAYMGNTLFLTLLCLIGQMIASPMVAYSISKVKWKGQKIIFPIIMSTMMIPYTVTMLPIYRVWTQFGLNGGYIPLIVPSFFGSAFYIILLRQFFMNLPDSLVEAAKIDGASQPMIYVRVMLPLCLPSLATVAIYVVLNTWSDYLGPLIYIQNADRYTLSLGLQNFVNANNVEWTMLMAGATLFVAPVVVFFIIFQRFLVEGISTTGLK